MGILRTREFFNRLSECKREGDVRELVAAERSYLNSSYTTLASKKNAYTAYRNYLREAFYKHPSLDEATVSGLIKSYLRLSVDEDKAFQRAHKEQVEKDNSNLRPIQDVDGHIETSVGLLKSGSYLDVIIGLSALTGRRTAEIGTSARFEVATPTSVVFYGQLKVKDREGVEAYEIPVLHDSRVLCEHLAAIRRRKPDLIGSPQKFHDCCGKNISVRVKTHYSGLYDSPLCTKDLRAIYAEICFQLYSGTKDKRMSQVAYYSKVLGHGELDLTTAHSYLDFYIADENFN